ncbi:MAG: thioredoxin-disulfide reductase [Prevotellaceae bacterium]|jgi:thioredoxin reductase (NADPH)|nr:thioredoxin-disulfide reductase [Prevotellaceae bacterium]
MNIETVKCLIIGGGPAGYTAAIYASRANLNPVLYEGNMPGGQLTLTTEVDNYPGYPDGVSGIDMMNDMKRQALRFGADIRSGYLAEADLSARPFLLTTGDGDAIRAETVIIATGATAKYLGLPSEEKYKGLGVSACATCDGFFHRKKDVAVVGGGDTACEDASYLAAMCRKVYLIVRRNELRASKAMQHRVKRADNIEILWERQVSEVLGDENGVTGLRLIDKTGSEMTIDVHGLFVAVGHHPNTEIFKPCIKTDEAGYIVTKGKTTETNVAGVFAAGDVADPRYRQGITAAASGCMAAKDAELFLLGK